MQKDFHRVPIEAREHLAILTALLDGDARGATRAMALHIRSGERYWSRVTLPLDEHQLDSHSPSNNGKPHSPNGKKGRRR